MNNSELFYAFLFHHIVTSANAHEFAHNGIERLYSMVEDLYGEESRKDSEWLIGLSLSEWQNKSG